MLDVQNPNTELTLPDTPNIQGVAAFLDTTLPTEQPAIEPLSPKEIDEKFNEITKAIDETVSSKEKEELEEVDMSIKRGSGQDDMGRKRTWN